MYRELHTDMKYTEKREVMHLDKKHEIIVSIRLDDECKNGFDEFAITGEVYWVRKNGRRTFMVGGCIHDEIAEHFPHLSTFIKLHLCDNSGIPMYAVENGFYQLQKGRVDAMARHLRATNEEAEVLATAEDEKHLKYLISKVGLLQKWREEAAMAIAQLEELCGKKYKPQNGNSRLDKLLVNDEEKKLFSQREEDGYYSESNREKRKEEKIREEREKRISQLQEWYKKESNSLELEFQLKLQILKLTLKDNFIYHSHINTVKFNWRNYAEKFTQEEYVDIVNALQADFPDITFDFEE